MSPLSLDTLAVPGPIREKLRSLSTSISFDKMSRKGDNSWLFFGTNLVYEQRVAVKFYDWAGDPAYLAEPRYLAALNADNVIKVQDAAFVNENFVYFVTPFFPKGDLDDEICRGIHGNIRAIDLTRDILSGVSHLHAASLLHRDLKPENILLSDDDHAVIGDFGSVKHLPSGQHTVPGSGHTLIYCPPESVGSGDYGIPGDLYQVGMVLYQLLGGALPYEEPDWLNASQLRTYRSITDRAEQQIFVNNVIKRRIIGGHVINLNSFPSWVCTKLRRTISKACNADPGRRYQSCSEFLARIGRIINEIHDWRVEDGCPTRHNGVVYRIVPNPGTDSCHVQKRRTGDWRNDNTFSGRNVADLVREIEKRNR